MVDFKVKILGCGSALPTTRHMPSSQLVEMNGKLFMIDCGEGTQLQMRKFGARMSKLHSIFISHLHGDHVFGLPGLISTFGLLGRTSDLNIYAHQELEIYLKNVLNLFCRHLSFKINFHVLPKNDYHLAFENKSIEIYSFPLNHRIASSGFLFKEKKKQRHMIREMIDFFKIPVKEINNIKSGADFITTEGKIIENERLTTSPTPPRSYAYCSDTAYEETIVSYIKNVDLLYHEATFVEADAMQAENTAHSTSKQAAQIAKMADVGKLIVGHFSSRYTELNILLEEAQSVFLNTELCEEGKVFSI